MLALVVAAIACGAWSLIEPHLLVVNRSTLTVPRWPAQLDGITIAALSDLHVGSPGMRLGDVDVVVARTNALDADVVVLLGDYVPGTHATADDVEQLARALGGLHARHGVFAVLGNHDQWTDGPGIAAALARHGVRVLTNEAVLVTTARGAVYLGGIDDALTGHADPARVLARVPAGAPLVGLAHEPDVFADLSPRFALLLAGHTHGGQVRLPFLGRLVVPSAFGQRYAAGWVEEGGRGLFVTTGLGTSILPVRFAVPPEIAALTLVAPP